MEKTISTLLSEHHKGTLSSEDKNLLIQELVAENDLASACEHHLSQLKSAVSSLAVKSGLWSSPKFSTSHLKRACFDLGLAFQSLQGRTQDTNFESEVPFALEATLNKDHRNVQVNALIPESLMSEVDHYVFALYGVEATRIFEPVNPLYATVERGAGAGPWVYLSGSRTGRAGGLIDMEETVDLLDLIYREMDRPDTPCSAELLATLERSLIAYTHQNGGSLEVAPYWLMVLQDILKRPGAEKSCPQILPVKESVRTEQGMGVRQWRITSDTVELTSHQK